MIKTFIIALISIALSGCAPMVINPTPEDGCKLSGFGGGNGTIEGKCTVKKGLIDFSGLRLEN